MEIWMRRALLLALLAACAVSGTLSGPADAAKRKRPAVEAARERVQGAGTAKPALDKAAPIAAAAAAKATPAIPAGDASAGPLDAVRLLEAQSALGVRLVDLLAASPGNKGPANIAVSPASLASVMALLDLGASEQMHKALHKTLALDLRAGANPVTDLEAVRTAVGDLAKADGTGPLTTANAVFFDESSKPFELAVAGLESKGADVSVGKLSDPATLERINAIVSKRTNGLIPTILDRPPTAAGLVAVNALHFKDRWRMPFAEKNTATAPFRLVDGRSVDVSMMRSASRPMMFRQDERFIAVDLPYATEGFSLVVVTTRNKAATPKELAAAQSWLTGGGFSEKEGEVSLPRFGFSQAADLLEAVDKLGLKPARSSKTAFGGLSPAPQAISAISQKAIIAVNEKGTEAAAATAVVTARGLNTDTVKMVVDKPFMFALRQQGSGLVLILGYVGDPTGAPIPKS
jgi:serpin B